MLGQLPRKPFIICTELHVSIECKNDFMSWICWCIVDEGTPQKGHKGRCWLCKTFQENHDPYAVLTDAARLSCCLHGPQEWRMLDMRSVMALPLQGMATGWTCGHGMVVAAWQAEWPALGRSTEPSTATSGCEDKDHQFVLHKLGFVNKFTWAWWAVSKLWIMHHGQVAGGWYVGGCWW